MEHLGESKFVVGVDIGATYSGYAFASRADIEGNRFQFSVNTWQGHSFSSKKCPTAVLLNKNEELEAFGYQAKLQFADLFANEKHPDYYFVKDLRNVLQKVFILCKAFKNAILMIQN